MNISNSLLNAYADYKNESLCGLQFKAIYIDKTHETVTTEAMKLGQWFEYMCTGALPRSGEIPEGPVLKSGDYSADGKKVFAQVANFKRLHGETDFTPSIDFIIDVDGHTFKGIFDMVVNNGVKKRIEDIKEIRDIKLTGVIDDKWSDFGWVNIQFKKHINQAKMYIWLFWKKYGRILPFYFDVFSSKNEMHFKVFRVTMTETSLREFEIYLMEAVNMINFDIETGFIAYPDLMTCATCPVGRSCYRFTDMPIIEEVKI